jgi:hypothetical protein
MYRQLQQEGRLLEFLLERQEAAHRVLHELEGRGVPHDQAWEVAKDEIYLPTEEDVPHLGENPKPYR